MPLGGHSWALRPLVILASMLPDGKTKMKDLIDVHMTDWNELEWPADFWVCTGRRDGTRIVFGQQPGEAPDLSVAIAASTAIPGYFSPVTMKDKHHLNGGLYLTFRMCEDGFASPTQR